MASLARGDGPRHPGASRRATPVMGGPHGRRPGHYGRSLAGRASLGPADPRLSPEDPSVVQVAIAHEVGRPGGHYPVPASWLGSDHGGHETVGRTCTWNAPVLSMVSTSAYFDEAWYERAFTSDTVLDPVVIAQLSASACPTYW